MTGKVRIYCSTHEAIFETAKGPRILCDITDHAMSVGFPNSEFWECCCNCETFAPSKLDKGEKAQKNCHGCGGTIGKRYLCSTCKIVSFECDARTKGRSYFIELDGIKPGCPGCGLSSAKQALVIHDCHEIGSEILTAKTACPFCLENIKQVPIPQPRVSPEPHIPAGPLQCPNCRSWIQPHADFCGKCRYQLRADVSVSNIGSEIRKTLTLGSLCPNCSTPIPPDCGFCGECGQAVKIAEFVPPPPPPPPARFAADFAEAPNLIFDPLQTSKMSPTSSSGVAHPIALAAGAVILIVIVIGLVAKSSGSSAKKGDTSNSSGAVTNRSVSNHNATVTSNTSTTPEADVRIGRTGTLTTDSHIRSASNKGAQDLGIHYNGAKIKVLEVDSYSTNDDYSTWFRVKVLENGCSMDGSNGCGNNNPEASDGYGWMQASQEGWINAKNIYLQ